MDGPFATRSGVIEMSTFKLFTLGLALPLGLAAQMVTAAPMAQADADAIFAALDADRNGQVTAEELARMPEARFAAQDTNGDGMLDAQELSASLQARMADRVDRMIGDLDLDGDGLLSQSEMMGGRDQHEGRGEPNFNRMLSRMDSNGDGSISLEEFSAMSQMRGGHERGAGAREGRGHRG
ncbi:MAG: calcium-binding protein [Rhodobacteraceae bacterium]|jgi:Ca2+-binding EF-hand superfamily protein|nr:calcium-binding protein [Paracoccaceae bacterium]